MGMPSQDEEICPPYNKAVFVYEETKKWISNVGFIVGVL